jgi:hypothetical protein
MKRLVIVLVFILNYYDLYGQDTISFSSFAHATQHIWGLIDTSTYPSGVLINKTVVDNKFFALNGEENSPVCSFAEYMFNLNNIRMAQTSNFDDNTFVIQLDSLAKDFCISNNAIPISISLFKYSFIDTLDFGNGNIIKNNDNRFVTSFYTEENIINEYLYFAASALIPGMQFRSFSFIVDTNSFYFGNNKVRIDSLRIGVSGQDSIGSTVLIGNPFILSFEELETSEIWIVLYSDDLSFHAKLGFSLIDSTNEQERSLCVFPEFYSGPAVEPDMGPFQVVSTRSGYNGTPVPRGEYAIWLGCGNDEIRKPIILSVGFNPYQSKKLLPCLFDENAWITAAIMGVTSPNIFSSVGGIAMFSALLLRETWNGQWRGTIYETANGVFSKDFAGNNGTNGTDNGTKFIEKLREEGYDIVLVQYDDGMSYIQNSAFVMIEVIKQINAALRLNGSKSEIAVGGYSAGALYTRYALTLMEKEYFQHKGTPLEVFHPHHRCNKYISIDGEHQGANIPLGFQNHINFWTTSPPTGPLDMVGTLIAAVTRNIINSTQARQTMIYHFAASQGGTNAARWNEFDELFLELRGFTNSFNGPVHGYPSLCRKIGISQGSAIGNTTLGITPASEIIRTDVKTIFSANPGTVGLYRKSRSYFTPPNGLSVGITNNKEWGMSVLFWGVWQWNNNSQFNMYTNLLPYDNAPGSVISTIRAYNNMGTKLIYQWMSLYSNFNDWGSQHLNHSFSPTSSGIDLHLPGNPIIISHPHTSPLSLGLMKRFKNRNNNQLVEPIEKNYGYPHLAYPNNHYDITPFDAIWAVGNNYDGTFKTNHFHVEDPQNDMSEFMSGELAPTSLYLSNRTIDNKITPAYHYVENGTIHQTDKYQALFQARNKIYVGFDVYGENNFFRDQAPLGNFIVGEFGDVNMNAEEIIFKTGTEVINGGKLHAKLGGFSTACNDVLTNPYRINPIENNPLESDSEKEIVIESNTEQIVYNIYPNPATDKLFFESNALAEIDKIIIYNIQGSLINNQLFKQNNIDISQLDKGMYFLKIQLKNGSSKSYKFVKA